uniref:Phage virion morphogenesis protein n=1 Tax=Geobacter sp. (strain M21) TaxID=443144 RepID=C6E6Q8_GEOSM
MAGSVETTGDWKRLKAVLEQASPKLKRESRRTIGKQLKKIEAKVLAHMDDQDLGWEELSEGYAEKKERAGLSPDTLRATNQMYSNITTAQDDDYSGAVGVMRGVKTGEGEELTDIALIHEQPEDDGKVMPARKLWKPTFDEMELGIAAALKGVAVEVFKR